MSLWKIAWRSIQQRSLASTLTAISMALGVALVVAVLVIHGVIDKSFRRSAQGYDLIIGPKGSRLDLVLNTVYHMGRPVGTLPYRYYTELADQRFAADVETAVPICMGDSYSGFRVIGTNPDMFDKLEYLDGQKYTFQPGGRNFDWNAPFEAVVGATAARKTGVKVGSTFRPVHGEAGEGEAHDDPFTIVGILEPTGTPIDRAFFVNIKGFYSLHTVEAAEEKPGSGAAPAEAAPTTDSASSASPHNEKSASHHHEEDEQKISAVLVVTQKDDYQRAMAFPRRVVEELDVQAVAPAEEIDRLFRGLVGDIQVVLLILAVLIVVVAGIGIMVSIYNSMNDRRREIAIMRALGARRSTVMAVILVESILLALGGGAIGTLLGHGLTGALAPIIAERTGVVVSALHFQTNELILIPGLIVLASAVGYMPAVIAYRTDVAQSLIASP